MTVGIANGQSIACAKAFRALGANLAAYLNDKAKKYLQPLAVELEASMFMPLDVSASRKWRSERLGASRSERSRS